MIKFVNALKSIFQQIYSFMGAEQQQTLKSSPQTQVLDIPTRLQWQNAHGYCGETSIQTCSLYYGSYISQYMVRKISEGEILVGQNAQPTIQKLGYTIDVWDSQNSPKPQYRGYLQWIKNQIKEGNPVIVCGYYPEGQNDEYDHIYLAVGYNSKNDEEYNDEDELIYMDLFEKEYTVTKFGKIWDTRAMDGNGKQLQFAFPKDVNWGVAITGIQDPEQQFLPVRINLPNKSEPNVSTNKEPVQFNYTVVVSDLEEGKKYALLRYDNYKSLPKKTVVEHQAASCKRFVANGDKYQMNDKVMSNGSVFYRCVLEENLE